MGLDAYVHCPCFIEGLATEPPVPARFDADEGFVEPQPGQPLERLLEFDQWSRHACAHLDMRVADDSGVIFSAVAFRQRVVSGPDANGRVLVVLEAEDGQALTTTASLGVERDVSPEGRVLFDYPSLLRVERRQTGTERFAYTSTHFARS